MSTPSNVIQAMVVMIGTWMQTHVSTKRKTFQRTPFCFGFYLFSFFCCWVNCHCSAPKHRCVCVACVVRVWYCFVHRLGNSTNVWAGEKEKERDEEDGEAQEGAKGKKQRRKAKSWSALPTHCATATRCPRTATTTTVAACVAIYLPIVVRAPSNPPLVRHRPMCCTPRRISLGRLRSREKVEG